MLIEVFVSLVWRYGLVAVFIYAARLWVAGYRFKGGERDEQERDVRNRTFILVGSLTSTSLEIFEHLAGKGAVVIALHPDPGDPVIVQLLLLLRSITRNEQLYVEKCDVTSVESISAFVEGWSQNARRGMVNDLEVVIDTIVFSDDDHVSSLSPTYINYNGVSVEATHAANLTSRLVFLNKFMPILKRSSELNSIHPIRIINVVNALYALGAPRSGIVVDLDYRKTQYPSLQPWIADARAALYSAAVFHQLQMKDMIVISVSPGFTRKYWRTLLMHKWRPYAFFPLKYCGLAMYIVLLPFIWLLTKSSSEASQGILHAIYTPIARHTHSALNSQDPALPKKLAPGGLYREGRLVPLKSFIPNAAKLSLYETEMDIVSSIVNRK